MNKKRIGLLVAATLFATPALAFAQPEEEAGGEEGEPAAEGEPAEGGEAAEGEGAAGEGDAAGGEGEPEGEDLGELPDEGEGGLGGICEIDPEACPELDMNKEAAKPLREQIYAVQQIYIMRAGRFELNPYWSITLNDQFVGHPGPGLALNLYITEVLAVGVNFNFYRPFNVDSDFNADVRRAARVGVPLTEYDWSAALNFTYVPAYGKFAGFGDFIFHWDAYVVGGVGALSSRPIPVIDPDNRNFEFRPGIMFNAGGGLRIYFNRWFAATAEIRDYIFNDELESLDLAPTAEQAQDEDTWYGDKKLTNNVQAQLGVSIFIPFSFEYRLPK
jgi:outer membrane beta-barrel protein